MTRDVPGDKLDYRHWEGAVAFRLFSGSDQPTLTVAEQIAASIGDRIISGALAPRERILEEELATEFSVSRGPVRDAIRILEREGLVTILPRRGAVVTDLAAHEVREIFEIRAGLLEIVARKVAAARDPDLLALLRAGVARLQRLAAMKDDQGAYAETSYRLSILSVRACGNQRLTRMLVALSLQTLRYAKLSLASAQRRQRSASIWTEALALLEAGDEEAYARKVRQRVEESGAEAARRLDAPEPARKDVGKPVPKAAP
ncbi:GntR family transcriptional regulator [Hydrogenophaga sp. BPS33]|uniref:GntR family transcriptional regulator n=1 Tax=Hydrogenophaga sp. BPS33 TaxID=2651974 RepID=UPI00131FD42B|nr:GntR family transcriptional regulator [Hydrogenophaga sp. BPS33]QHE85765.1 GntR family transcriptional regulator [Hydrogenophaga sp. BPS33]